MSNQFHHDDVRFFELLQQWHSGAFTRAEEKELFALAAKDPFRQDALDGLLAFPEHDHDKTLEQLRLRLPQEQRPLVFSWTKITALAAAFVLLIAAVWFFQVRPVTDPAQDSLARNETTIPVPTTTLPPSSDAEPPASVPKPESKVNPAPNRSAAGAPQLPSSPVDAQSGQLAAADTDDQRDVQQPGVTVGRSTNVAQPEEIAAESAKMAEASDEEHIAKDALSKEDDAPAAKYDKTTKKTKAPAAKSQNKPVNSPGAEPMNGWDAFNTYIRSNARLNNNALANNVSGIVRLQFTVNNKNQPENFKTLNSLGFGCDEEAIRLVKNYGWKRISNQPVLVDVPFVR